MNTLKEIINRLESKHADLIYLGGNAYTKRQLINDLKLLKYKESVK